MTTPTDIKYIVTDPDVYGGRPIIAGHRIAVIDVAVWTQHGMMPEQIAAEYPLTSAEIHAALTYYLSAAEGPAPFGLGMNAASPAGEPPGCSTVCMHRANKIVFAGSVVNRSHGEKHERVVDVVLHASEMHHSLGHRPRTITSAQPQGWPTWSQHRCHRSRLRPGSAGGRAA